MKKFMIAAVALMSAVMVMFAGTTDRTGTGGTTGYPPFGSGVHLFQRTIDFSDTTANTGTVSEVYQLLDIPAGTKILAVGYELLENRNGYTGDILACTIDVGDGSDTDGWLDGANVRTGQTAIAWSSLTLGASSVAFATNVTVTSTNLTYMSATNTTSTVSVVTGVAVTTSSAYAVTAATGYSEGKFYTATDTIDMIMSTNAVNLKIRLSAIGIGAKKDW